MRKLILVIVLGSVLGCGDSTTKKVIPGDDMGSTPDNDMDSMSDGMETTPDSDADLGTEPGCELVVCAENSRCVVVDNEAICECLPGFEQTDDACLSLNQAPSFTNLPGVEAGQSGESDSFILTATDPDEPDELRFSLASKSCAFDIQVVAESGLVTWTCPTSSTECVATMQVTDEEGLSDSGELAIQCVRNLPVISSSPPTQATEHTTLQYAVQCSDPDGDAVTISKAADDTCGGSIQGNTYVWTPNETQGGSTCLLKVQCANAETTESQGSLVAVQETNSPPEIQGLPHTQSTLWGRSGSYQVTATDSDVPAQNLTFSLTTTCGFSPSVSTTGLVTYVCGTSLGSCATTVSVNDGQSTNSGVLTTNCTNTTPAVSAVSISPSQPIQGSTLTCNYSFSDADGDADQSLIEWLVNGSVLASGSATFTNFAEGDQVACRVTPRDGNSEGASMTSPSVTQPYELKVKSGTTHVCVRNETGGLRCWGANAHGNIGVNFLPGNIHTPTTPLGMGIGVSDFALGASFTCAVQSRQLKCWGAGTWGLLGPGITGSNWTPVTIFNSGITGIFAGSDHACAIHNGALKCWGANSSGQVGNAVITGSFDGNPTPTTVTGFETGVTKVAIGHSHTCAIRSGSLYCWGLNNNGQLGRAANAGSNPTPTVVPGLSSGVDDVVAGNTFTCARHNSVWKCWGDNRDGQLGRTTATDSDHNPAPVMGSPGGTLIARYQNVCTLQGGLKCWGTNLSRELNTDGVFKSTAPLDVLAPTVTSLGIGYEDICAVRNGNVYCWGANYAGEMGTGTATDETFPPTLVNH